MYRYYQKGDYDTWKCGEDKEPNDLWGFARLHEAGRITVCCVSNDIDLANSEIIKYAGPLFFDVDHVDLSVALSSAVTLCTKLKALGVAEDDIEIHLSGKKGVHIYINQQVFCKDEQVEFLPEIYARMAMHLWVDGIDFAVYSEGKGRMVRPPNARRPDGRYKVQVSFQELQGIDADNYAYWVKEPRTKPLLKGIVKWAAGLSKCFQGCKSSLSSKKATDRTIPSESIAKLKQEVPDCVKMLGDGKRRKVKGDAATSYNNMAMQVGCWSKYSLVDAVVLESVQQRISANNPSTSGDSQYNRFRKIQSMHLYLKGQDKYKFSCSAIKKVIEGTPNCSSCPIYAEEQSSYALLDGMYLHEKMGSYYSDKDCTTLVAPFTLTRDCMVINEETDKIETTMVSVKVPMSCMTFKIQDFDESAWISKVNLKKELSGLDGVAFMGSDNDVTRLRYTLFRDDLLSGAEVKQVAKANKIGVSYRRRSGPEDPRNPEHKGRLTYVEPGFSLNDVGVYYSHMLIGSVRGSPNMKSRDFNVPISDKANEAFSLFLKINNKYFMSVFLGWFLATHLKSHVFKLEHRFPLLCISGLAGTGKNSATAVAMRLCGVEGENALMTLEAPNATKLPFQQALSDSATVPRIINELNPKSMHRTHYSSIIELLKAAFDSQTIQKGRIGGGDRNGANVSTVDWRITAPVVTLSEEPIGIPAVLQRGIMLDMTPRGMTEGRQSFMELEPRADDLVDIGRVLIRESLNTSIQEIDMLLKTTKLPTEVSQSGLTERLKFGYKVIMVAYLWGIEALTKSGLSENNAEQLRSSYLYLRSHLARNIQETMSQSSMTEVDKVIKDIAVMAHQTSNSAVINSSGVTKGIHYAVQSNILYLDVIAVYPFLIAFKRGELGIKSDEAFMRTVKSMDYYVSDHAITNLLPTGGRVVLSLDMDRMAEKGLPVQMFL